ncbi:hypothetical protein Pmani_035975 [Petrolisthes manimaculis]|uniref:Uncharacterized protein n=1 Tax=Petrolisthes manimaculis TaxID=1843537 RepID=A0AAE1NJH1_9EUCA|nr:hypothetical protein Pmani_035975 [Petrolisthes manimaculis]
MKQHLRDGYQQAEAERRRKTELGMPLLGKEEITEFRPKKRLRANILTNLHIYTQGYMLRLTREAVCLGFESSDWSCCLPRSPTDATHHHYFDSYHKPYS